jgi:hypothetical protein
VHGPRSRTLIIIELPVGQRQHAQSASCELAVIVEQSGARGVIKRNGACVA